MIKTMSQRFSQHFMAFMAKLTSKYSIYLILIAMLFVVTFIPALSLALPEAAGFVR